jgi:hypothetical protein
MKTIHIFTEEPSAKNVFEAILPKLLPNDVTFRVYPHQGKQDLEKALKTTLPSICKMPGARILVTRDQDSEDCVEVKERIRDVIADRCSCGYYIRIICRELESWFLGDLEAIRDAFPRFKPDNYSNKADFRNVDKINQPNRYLLKIIPEYSGRETLPKLEVSETIAPLLDLDSNKSHSFNQTLAAIRNLAYS